MPEDRLTFVPGCHDRLERAKDCPSDTAPTACVIGASTAVGVGGEEQKDLRPTSSQRHTGKMSQSISTICCQEEAMVGHGTPVLWGGHNNRADPTQCYMSDIEKV